MKSSQILIVKINVYKIWTVPKKIKDYKIGSEAYNILKRKVKMYRSRQIATSTWGKNKSIINFKILQIKDNNIKLLGQDGGTSVLSFSPEDLAKIQKVANEVIETKKLREANN